MHVVITENLKEILKEAKSHNIALLEYESVLWSAHFLLYFSVAVVKSQWQTQQLTSQDSDAFQWVDAVTIRHLQSWQKLDFYAFEATCNSCFALTIWQLFSIFRYISCYCISYRIHHFDSWHLDLRGSKVELNISNIRQWLVQAVNCKPLRVVSLSWLQLTSVWLAISISIELTLC